VLPFANASTFENQKSMINTWRNKLIENHDILSIWGIS